MLSSGAVYGPAREGLRGFAEDNPGGPGPSLASNAYAEGKRAAEQVCAIAATEGLPVRIARCFAFVGPHMPFDRHFAIGNFIADAVDGRPIRVRSDGRPLRSYLYMSDLVRALLAIRVLIEGAPSDPLDRYVPDVTRIRTELGFTEQVALDDAIARTARWRRAQLREPMRS
jgi:dTDP-glucose 4,6-dehydratase